MKPGTLAVTVVLAGAGYLFAATASTARGTQLRVERPDTQNYARAETARLAERGERLRDLAGQIDEMRRRASAGDAELAGVRQRLRDSERAAGLSEVRGPGLRITLDDAPRGRPQAAGVGPDDLVVHQQDVQAVVNALWAGGAEAMQLQDQRVITTSAVRCVGNTLILQGRVYSPPYVITAVGDVAGMRDAIAASSQIGIYREYVKLVGLGWDEQRLSSYTVPAWREDTSLVHAQPVPVADTPAARPSSSGSADRRRSPSSDPTP
ncbi:MAG: DUF881 domain-containing protein [Kineosporiaceae bacterium]